ncbi:hypothetical protein LOB14_07410 [Lactobacillus delbrueckii subsp. lactis]|uniref:hypothetical protein n=1 Tax=Lactobacillus delbrueckii TaxID=1584 RepID=UPI001E471CC3|nr:hypothetical protein [Lactobacillus delbrueckii]MCD5431280.1 hypothetical protein [Lactobacillus delbrueckii subsp. lactis]MCD5433127.1 hypothetical protein [Lactobacillus delbrueckii subsp. lactis]MCD5472888.1 hypothetical protein [Lactobacillus delbrueckii subsp. lactis]
MTPNLTAFTGVDSQNLADVMVSVQFILAIGEQKTAMHLSPSEKLKSLLKATAYSCIAYCMM